MSINDAPYTPCAANALAASSMSFSRVREASNGIAEILRSRAHRASWSEDAYSAVNASAGQVRAAVRAGPNPTRFTIAITHGTVSATAATGTIATGSTPRLPATWRQTTF